MIKKFIVYILCAVFLISCSKNSEIVEIQPEVEEQLEEQEEVVTPKKGGEMTISMRSPKTLNPLLNEDITVDSVLKLMFEPLVKLDESNKPVPNIASSFYISADSKSVTIKLRSDIKWHDGTALTSDDLIYSLNTLKGEASALSIYKDCVKDIINFTKVDDLTVNINYKDLYFGSLYSLNFPVVPQHYFKDKKTSVGKVPPPMGNGAYEFSDYLFNKELILKSTKNSFNKNSYIDSIKVLITLDDETDMYAFDQGLIDVITSNISGWGRYRGKKEIEFTDYVTNIYDFIGFNLNNINLENKKFRQAIAMAINMDDIVDSIYLSHAVRAYSPINPSSWLHSDNLTKYEYDLEGARELLSSLGFLDDRNFLYKVQNDIATELKLRILVNEENEERFKIASIIQESLRHLKINSEIHSVSFEEYIQRVKSKDFEIFLGGYNLSEVPDISFAFHSSSIQNGQNYFNYKNELLDSLLVSAVNTTSENTFKSLLQDVQKIISDDIPCISIAFRNSVLLTDKNIYGNKKPTQNNIYENIEEWFTRD